MSDTPTCSIQIDSPTGDTGRVAGELHAPVSGVLVLTIDSPRPLRLWLGERLLLDEDLWWRRYERLLRAIVVVPVADGRHSLAAEYGPRPSHPHHLDAGCPSRNRQRVIEGALQRRPDRIGLAAEVQRGAAPVAACLRVLPGQCVISGVTYQHVLARLLDAPRPGVPSTDLDRPGWLPRPTIALCSSVAPHHARDASDDADRAAGCIRFLVPVANHAEPLPAARVDDGPDDRLEPECVIVRTLGLSIEPALAELPGWERTAPVVPAAEAARATMPVHECRGRHAPVREHRELKWPTADDLLARCPRPIVPAGHESIVRAHDHAWRMLLRLRRPVDPRSGLPNDYVGTAMGGFLNEMFVWDSSFTAMCTAWGWRLFPYTATLDCLYSRQMDGGYLHRETDVREGIPIMYEPDFSPNPPISAVAEWKIASLTGDTARLAAVYPVLAGQHGWLRRNRRLSDGTYWTTGLANGLDNSPSLGDGYPDLTAQQAHAAETLGLMAAALGRADDARAWEAERQKIGAAMNARLWSDSMQFYSTSLPGGGHNTNKVATGFWPLWSGLVPPDRVEHLARHLLDPSSFWRHHPVPSLAADSPHYRSGGDYWLGSTWAPTNAATAWGFARSGRFELARRLARRHLDVVSEVRDATDSLWENFAPDASARGSWSMPDYSWTALAPTALFYELVLGVQPDALGGRILWHLPEPGWGLSRIPLGGATIDLIHRGSGKITVVTDRAFTLDVADGETTRRMRVPAGRWDVAVGEMAERK